MKFKYTILYVEDVRATLNFYQAAFGFEIKMLHESGDYGELNTGDTTLSLSSLTLMQSLNKFVKSPDDAATFEIAFETENVQQALDRAISAGAELIQPLKEEPWGQTTSYVKDHNGFLIEICSAVAL